jgi:hypothetical protein
MSSQHNRHIAAFRKVSGYLLWLFNPLLVFAYLAGLVCTIGLISIDSGGIGLLQSIVKLVDDPNNLGEFFKPGITLFTRIFLLILLGFFFVPCIYILTHVQKLVKCFQSGDIFNVRALTHARKAYQANFYFSLSVIFLHFTAICFVAFHLDKGNSDRFIDWIYLSGITLIDLGLYSLTLLALEIGTNLNEEAELTI